jgi:hypothetical protein
VADHAAASAAAHPDDPRAQRPPRRRQLSRDRPRVYRAEAVARYAWKTSSIRGQTIRLVQDAVRMMRGGYRMLLRGA